MRCLARREVLFQLRHLRCRLGRYRGLPPSRLAEAKQLGFERVILPEANHRRLEETREGLELVPVRSVVDALDALF